MRHRKQSVKLGRSRSHNESLMANMLKSLIENGRIVTTLEKAKELRRHADRMITLAKQGTLASRRRAIAKLKIRFNALDSKEQKAVKNGDTSSYNTDRKVVPILFDQLGKRFATRSGGYTRIIKKGHRAGDDAKMCIIEYLAG